MQRHHNCFIRVQVLPYCVGLWQYPHGRKMRLAMLFVGAQLISGCSTPATFSQDFYVKSGARIGSPWRTIVSSLQAQGFICSKTAPLSNANDLICDINNGKLFYGCNQGISVVVDKHDKIQSFALKKNLCTGI